MAIVPQTMDEAYRLGKAISISGMAPHGMDTPEKCMIAIMRGMEVGLSPMQAVDKIAIVNGRPTIWGDGAIGLVRGSGLCEFVQERLEGDGDKRVATCSAKRKGEPEPTIRTFSVEQAKKAGLWGKSGPWQQFPDRMLQMRARAFALRDLFADVLGGLYLREEIEDDRRQDGPVAPPPPVTDQSKLSGPAAPPVEDAEIVETPSPAEGGGNDGAAQDDADRGEAFDGDAWLAETATVFASCKTAQDVDEAHDMFEETVQHELNKDQRYQYEKLHTDAMMRTKGPSIEQSTPAAPPAEDDDDSFPGDDAIKATAKPEEPSPGAAYMARIRQAIADPVRTAASLTGLWNATGDERKALERDGYLAKEDRVALREEIAARIAAVPAADAPSAPPAGPSAPPSDEDPAAAFDRDFRAKVADCGTVEDLNSLSTNTLKQRNAFGSTHPLYDGWREAVSHRRKQLSGIA